MEPSRLAGKRLRLVTRKALLEALEGALAEAGGSPELALERLRQSTAQDFVARLRANSTSVRAVSRAEFLTELGTSQARFAREKLATEQDLVALEGAPVGGGHDPVDILERRVAKLRAALARLEGQYSELARRAHADPGLGSEYRDVQGRPTPQRREMLRQVLEENIDLQRRRAG